jgi:hypothetical protein
MKASICFLSCSIEVNEAPVSDWACKIENQHSTWFSQDARVGVLCWSRLFEQLFRFDKWNVCRG